MYLGSTEGVQGELGAILSQGGMKAANPLLRDFMQFLMGNTQNVQVPEIPSNVLAALDAEMNRATQYGTDVINRQVAQAAGDIQAMSGAYGSLGSTGQGAAVGRAQQAGIEAIANLLNEQMMQRSQYLNALRGELMGAQTQRLGIGANVYPNVMGMQLGGLQSAAQMAMEQERAKAERWNSVLGALGAIGGAAGTALFGPGGWLGKAAPKPSTLTPQKGPFIPYLG